MLGGLYSLATIIKRLEAATLRLEDLAVEHHTTHPRIIDDLRDEPSPNSYIEHSSPPAFSAPPPPPPPPPPPTVAEVPRSVLAFDEAVIDGKLKPFLDLTRSFAGASLIEQVTLVEKEFTDLRALLLIAASCEKPDQRTFGELLSPLQEDIETIIRLKEANRKDRDWFIHLSTVAEGAPCIGWVTVDMKPGSYVNDIKDSTLFYGNRVIKEFKDKDPKHAEWVKAYIAILEETRQYIMAHHTTGLVWNSRGIPVSQFIVSSSASSKPGGGPPPPPPPPASRPSGTAAGGGAAAVFAELNRGEEVTKGLRKVDKSEMTHKNPALRAGSVVPASPGPAAAALKKPIKPSKPKTLMGKKPSKFALEGNKWVIEYQENEPGLVVEDAELSQTVSLYGCKNSTVIIKGKINGVTLVNCVKTSVLVESVISAVSVTSSPSFTLQITGSAPTIQLDSTDSGHIYLSKECLGVEITTAKCSSININLPVEGEEDGVFEEQAVPEMLKTVVKDGKLVTSVVEHVG